MTLRFPKIIGHRGAAAHAPENTLSSFALAKKHYATWIEFDVKLTKDLEAIVFHDETLERTTSGQGYVREKMWDEVKNYDAGILFPGKFSGERIPTLKETFTHLEILDLGANIELKPCRGREKETAEVVVELLTKEWPSSLPLPLISSFNDLCLQHFQNQFADKCPYPIGVLFEEDLDHHWRLRAKSLNATTIHASHKHLPDNLIGEICKEYPLLVYTVNDTQLAQRLFAAGVSAVFTDDPLHLWQNSMQQNINQQTGT